MYETPQLRRLLHDREVTAIMRSVRGDAPASSVAVAVGTDIAASPTIIIGVVGDPDHGAIAPATA